MIFRHRIVSGILNAKRTRRWGGVCAVRALEEPEEPEEPKEPEVPEAPEVPFTL